MGRTPSPGLALDYVVNARLPTEKAHGLQVVRQCEALARLGVDLRLYHAWRFQSPEMAGAGPPLAYYGVPSGAFALRPLLTADLQLPLDPYTRGRLRRALFWLQAISFAGWAPLHARAGGGRWIYTRDLPYAAALVACGAGRRTILEEHRFPARGHRLYRATLRQLAGVVTITRGIADLLLEAGLPAERLLVAPDAVRPEDFLPHLSPAQARVQLGLDPAAPLVVYTGHLFPWKGVDALVQAAAHLARVQVLVVGGLPEDRRRLQEEHQVAPNLRFLPHQSPARIPLLLAAASVLVLPGSGRHRASSIFTSPMKLFEYMAAGRPIVASDLPSLREVLVDGETARLVRPDDPGALAAGVREVLEDPALASRLGTAALRRAQACTWEARARLLMAFVRERSSR